MYRVNPCAIVASAPDGSSHNIYFYGGQNLVPYGDQIQYNDMWVLSVPAFTWIEVDAKVGNPPGRAGHSCEVWGRQMIVIGGYVTQELSCDSPGIYVFDITSLEWKTEFTGIGKASKSETGGDLIYHVPQVIHEVIGGSGNGGATVTKPVVGLDSDSPLQTGGGVTYTYSQAGPGYTYIRTITNSDGSFTTTTHVGGTGNGNDVESEGQNIGLIIGTIIGGLAALVILVFLCLFILYKRKIRQMREKKLVQMEGRKLARQSRGRRESAMTASFGSEEVETRSAYDLLLDGTEPNFWGVILSPRRTLRVVNS